MPSRAVKFCNHPGCNELVSGSYCDTHNAQHEQRQKESKARFNEKRGSSSERGYDDIWKKARLSYLKRNPLCEQCQRDNILTPAVLVHHVKPISEGGDRLSVDNLMSLCNRCHEDIHGKDRFKRTV